MRAGGSCSLQQSLSPEAAALVKQAVTLAKRRGHGQVTPLHVAATMLASSTGLFRAACLLSHSHPLHCKALELCFNVALNRLPAASSSSSSFSGGHAFGIHKNFNPHQVPSISNALIAAFKRAQGHQRRGGSSAETNQSLLAIKIELDQLVISILDDPSVSRVMREAGFSSSQVKSNVERAVSSPANTAPARNTTDTNDSSDHMNPSNTKKHPKKLSQAKEEDVIHVMDNLMNKRRRSIVVVGERADTIETVARGVADKLRNYEDPVAQTFHGVQFVDLSLHSNFEHIISREGAVEQKLGQVRAHIRSSPTGTLLFMGDLRWVVENQDNPGIEHLMAEIGKLICGVLEDDERVWVMGITTLQSYMRCKSLYPSIQSLWRLHPVAVPAGSLSFHLIANSDAEADCLPIKKRESGSLSSTSWLLPLHQSHSVNYLDGRVDRSPEFEKSVHSSPSGSVDANLNRSTSSLPPWLQRYKDEKKIPCERALTISSSSPSPSSSGNYSHEIPNPNPPNSASSSDEVMEVECFQRFNHLREMNTRLLLENLAEIVPWQKQVIPEIVTTVLRCRSGLIKRKGNVKNETWFLFQGGDKDGKEKMAREVARLVFGSYDNLVSISLSCWSTSQKGFRNLKEFSEAVSENPHRVFFIEDIAKADRDSREYLKRAIERGLLVDSSGEEVDLKDAIVIISHTGSLSTSTEHIRQDIEVVKETNPSLSLDLNISIDLSSDSSGIDRHHRTDIVDFAEYVDKAVVFEIQEL